MALLGAQDLRLRYGGGFPLLDGVSLQVEEGERICLVGRNGEGKSSLLRILAGEEKPDGGTMALQSGLRLGFLPQSVPRGLPGAVMDVVLRRDGAPAHEDWEVLQRAKETIGRMNLDPAATFDELSGGQKRRALLARALAVEPDLLLLDEPTNHLDIESIEWMENLLLRHAGALLFVTHDRAFVRRLATRILELDRGRLTSYACDYDRYLERREQALAAEEKQNALFDKKLGQEETWLRKGVRARRTRNEGRVKALLKMREERRRRRAVSGSVTMAVQEGGLSGRKVVTAAGLSYAWDGVPIVRDFSASILRGDKVGIIGPNGCGKTTLLKLLLGHLAPSAGAVEHGTNLEIAFFDQHREAIDDGRTVAENIAGDNDFVVLNGTRRHVLGYLEDFLFPPDRSRTKAGILSGGERNRLLLAKLFLKPSNVLVLDEPTNDLDAETLELLEDLLVEYPGTVLLVSHDREFLNRVVTSTLVFEGGGRIGEYVGGYDDWIRQRPSVPADAPAEPVKPAPRPARARARKLSWKEARELEGLPARIEALETELGELHRRMSGPDFYRQPPDDMKRLSSRAEALPAELESAYGRWAELEGIRDNEETRP